MVPRVNTNNNSWGGMADEERSAAAGQNDTQARGTAETEGGNAGDVTPTPMIADEITPQSPVQADTDTRRTSMSSRAGENMQASLPSLQSGTGEGGGERQTQSQRRARPQVARLDYGSMRGETSTTGSSRQNLSTPGPQTPRRPGTMKRVPSSAAPHRGEVFSVDDDPEEVGEDLRLAKTLTRQDRERDRDRQLRRRESTIRRRPTAAQPPTLRTVSSEGDEEHAQSTGNDAAAAAAPKDGSDPSSEETLAGEEEEEEEEETPSPDEDDADLSDAESFTLRDRQQAINETHPFGIRIWKPAVYKKNRSVQRNAEGDIHSAPGGNVSSWLFIFNVFWTLVFGWWLAILAAAGGALCMLFSILQFPGCWEYGRVLINLSHYIFYPFGKYVKLERDEAYMEEDEGEGRSISEYERWQTGDLEEGRLFFGPTDINRSLIGRRREEVEDLPNETDSLLGRQRRHSSQSDTNPKKVKNRLFGRGSWDVGRVIFFLSFYILIVPCMFLVSMICWFFVFTIPMGKVTLLLIYHLRRHPLALSFHTDRGTLSRTNSVGRGASGSSILLCTYRAVGTKYWKYTIDGQNIFLINLLGLVVFVIFDYFVLYTALGIETWLTSNGFVFVLALASIIPLAYFIGQAVASISAQSSMGVGATINAFFSTVVEVFLYCIALKEGKASLVEGSIIGSIFAGILFLPGLSMCFGAIKRKTQRFNVKSAGVTSTMLLFAVIAAFGPTLFYQIYGSHELQCYGCVDDDPNGPQGEGRDCRRCFFNQSPAVLDAFYTRAVRPYIYFAATMLFLSYVVGLLFTLRTHAAVIWNNEPDEKKELKAEQSTPHRQEHVHAVPGTAGLVDDPRGHMTRQGTTSSIMPVSRENIRDSQMYKRILNQSLKQAGVMPATPKPGDTNGPFMVPPKTPDGEAQTPIKVRISGLSMEDNRELVQEMAEMAASAATIAARDATKAPRRASIMASTAGSLPRPKEHASTSSKDTKSTTDGNLHRTSTLEQGSLGDFDLPSETPNAPAPGAPSAAAAPAAEPEAGGHDAPNWSRAKSAVILLIATIAYAIIAEILVDTVDAVLSNIDIDEKFLGITLFALVPNTTEFLNAISFAMNGNVALSMEIGSSYALQVMLLQIPALVLFSAIYQGFLPEEEVVDHTFSLIFPQWDMVTIILSVFLMGWVVGEGKSNYFKGSILIFSYLTIGVGFWFSGFVDMDTMGVNRFDTLALGSSPAAQSFKTIGRSKRGMAY